MQPCASNYVDTYFEKEYISLINFTGKYVLWIGKHTILVIAFHYQSMSITVRNARKLLSEEIWVFSFGLKMVIISIVIAGRISAVKVMPQKISKLINN